MGRGLSDLQQFVLKQTAKKGILFREEIKEGFFHWKPERQPWPFAWPEETLRKNNAVSASFTRALTRLHRRGLIIRNQYGRKKARDWERFRFGIVLTDKGRNYVRERLGLKPKKLKEVKECGVTVQYPIG